MTEGKDSSRAKPKPVRSRRRDLIELALAYGLILVVVWTPRPWQRYFWVLAVVSIAAIICFSFEGADAMGLRRRNFPRSLWVVGAALALSAAAVIVAAPLHTLQLQPSPMAYVKTFSGYAIWTFVQQFLMQCFFLSRLVRLLPGPKSAALATALIFALAHLPNPILTPVTLLWGFAACLLFLRYRNLYTLAMAHAIFGITVAITIPGPVVHNMRVGLGYLTYGHHAHPQPLPLLKP
jgi:membrane protease YdiL (CAAX protease family)